MMMWFSLVGLSWAEPLLERPSPPVPAPNECAQSTAIIADQPIPFSLARGGIAVCGAVAEPTSSLAYLLAIEKYSRASDDMHAIEVSRLHAQIDGLMTPPPWHQRPKAQRWIGRFEVLAIVGVVSLGVYAANTPWRAK